MKKFCEYFKKHTMQIINFKKEKIKLLTKEQQKSYQNAKICYICKEKLEHKYVINNIRQIYRLLSWIHKI